MRDRSDESVAISYQEGATDKRGHLVSSKRLRPSSFTQGKYPHNIYNRQVINLLLGLRDVPFSKKWHYNCSYTLTDVALDILCLSYSFLLVGRFSPVLSWRHTIGLTLL
jgi:hypothetical protein